MTPLQRVKYCTLDHIAIRHGIYLVTIVNCHRQINFTYPLTASSAPIPSLFLRYAANSPLGQCYFYHHYC